MKYKLRSGLKETLAFGVNIYLVIFLIDLYGKGKWIWEITSNAFVIRVHNKV